MNAHSAGISRGTHKLLNSASQERFLLRTFWSTHLFVCLGCLFGLLRCLLCLVWSGLSRFVSGSSLVWLPFLLCLFACSARNFLIIKKQFSEIQWIVLLGPRPLLNRATKWIFSVSGTPMVSCSRIDFFQVPELVRCWFRSRFFLNSVH